MTPQRIQRKRERGWKMPSNTVSVTRPGRWGNPFPVSMFGVDGALRLYRMWLQAEWHPDMAGFVERHESRYGWPSHQIIQAFLRGKDLACWCKPGDPCHAEVLLEIANAQVPTPPGADI
jgi:hypothetical protein